MPVLYVDCSAGVSGEALLGALYDVTGGFGLPFTFLKDISRDIDLACEPAVAGGVPATRVVFKGGDSGRTVIAADYITEKTSSMKIELKHMLSGVLLKYLEARAKTAGLPLAGLKMKEGELQNIFALSAGFLHLLAGLGYPDRRVISSPIPVSLGAAFEKEEQGHLLLELARGAKIKGAVDFTPCSTPLGAALLAAVTHEYGLLPEMRVDQAGYGVLAAAGPEIHTLRIIKGVSGRGKTGTFYGEGDTVLVLETSIDDMNPETIPYLIELLLGRGALDAFTAPINMKKGRPANQLTVLCRKEKLDEVLLTIFKESTTLGVRIREERRIILRRDFFMVATAYGDISIKTGHLGREERPVQVAPEYEDCRKAAERTGAPLKLVYAAALKAALDRISY